MPSAPPRCPRRAGPGRAGRGGASERVGSLNWGGARGAHWQGPRADSDKGAPIVPESLPAPNLIIHCDTEGIAESCSLLSSWHSMVSPARAMISVSDDPGPGDHRLTDREPGRGTTVGSSDDRPAGPGAGPGLSPGRSDRLRGGPPRSDRGSTGRPNAVIQLPGKDEES
eukprot:459935-Hanusia_phi.AAC.1